MRSRLLTRMGSKGHSNRKLLIPLSTASGMPVVGSALFHLMGAATSPQVCKISGQLWVAPFDAGLQHEELRPLLYAPRLAKAHRSKHIGKHLSLKTVSVWHGRKSTISPIQWDKPPLHLESNFNNRSDSPGLSLVACWRIDVRAPKAPQAHTDSVPDESGPMIFMKTLWDAILNECRGIPLTAKHVRIPGEKGSE